MNKEKFFRKIKVEAGKVAPLPPLPEGGRVEVENEGIATIQNNFIIIGQRPGQTYLNIYLEDGACYDRIKVVVKRPVIGLVPWLLIVLLTATLIYQLANPPRPVDKIKTGPPGVEQFFSSWPLKKETPEKKKPSGKIGLAVPAGVRADSGGNAVITIKNSGTVPVVPVVKFRGKEVYRCSRALSPGETVAAKVAFGKGSGIKEFEVLAEPGTGSVGMAVVSKIQF